MPFNGGFGKSEEQSRAETLRRVGGNPDALGDAIGGSETDSEDVFGESEGIFADDIDRGCAVLAIGFDGDTGSDPVPSEKDHDLLDSAVLLP